MDTPQETQENTLTTQDSSTMSLEKASLMASMLLVFLTPFIYLLAVSFHQGYLSGYGLHYEFYTKSFEEYMVLGFSVILDMTVDMINFFLNKWLLTLPIILLFLLAVKELEKHAEKFNGLKAIHRFRLSRQAEPYLVATIVFVTPIALIYLFALSVLPHYFAFHKGEVRAKEEISNFESCEYKENWHTCYTLLKDGKKVAEGSLIFNSNDAFALFSQSGSVVFPKSEGYTIEKKRTNTSQRTKRKA